MAHIQKNNRSAIGHLFDHYGRTAEGEKTKYIYRGNASIKPDQTYLNYNLAPERETTQHEFLQNRLSELKAMKRQDINIMCSWVVTLPKSFPKEREREFFKETYNFLENRYGGAKNVISAYVHKDETTPHLHFAFIPAIFDEKKDQEKLCAKEVINRIELKKFHPDLKKHLDRVLDLDVEILNEATAEGNQSVADLKRGSAVKLIVDLTAQVSKLSAKLGDLQRQKTEVEQWLKSEQQAYNGILVKIQKATQKKDFLEADIREMQKLGRTLLPIRGQLKTAKEDLSQTITELKDFQAEGRTVEASIKARKSENSELGGRIMLSEYTLDGLEKTIAVSEKTVGELEIELKKMANELKKTGNEFTGLKSEVSTTKKKAESLNKEIKVLTADRDTLVDEKAKLRANTSKFVSADRELERLNRHYEADLKDIDSWRQEIHRRYPDARSDRTERLEKKAMQKTGFLTSDRKRDEIRSANKELQEIDRSKELKKGELSKADTMADDRKKAHDKAVEDLNKVVHVQDDWEDEWER